MTETKAAPVHVVTAFVTRDGKVLALRRSAQVGTYQGKWAGVSGYLEQDDPLEQAWTELAEELGVQRSDAVLAARGAPVAVSDQEGRRWIVHAFRFVLSTCATPRLDWEHVEQRWIDPAELATLDAVPGLYEVWQSTAQDATAACADKEGSL